MNPSNRQGRTMRPYVRASSQECVQATARTGGMHVHTCSPPSPARSRRSCTPISDSTMRSTRASERSGDSAVASTTTARATSTDTRVRSAPSSGLPDLARRERGAQVLEHQDASDGEGREVYSSEQESSDRCKARHKDKQAIYCPYYVAATSWQYRHD